MYLRGFQCIHCVCDITIISTTRRVLPPRKEVPQLLAAGSTSPFPQTVATTDVLSSSMVYLFWTFYITEIVQYAVFCIWLLLLSIFSRFIHTMFHSSLMAKKKKKILLLKKKHILLILHLHQESRVVPHHLSQEQKHAFLSSLPVLLCYTKICLFPCPFCPAPFSQAAAWTCRPHASTLPDSLANTVNTNSPLAASSLSSFSLTLGLEFGL